MVGLGHLCPSFWGYKDFKHSVGKSQHKEVYSFSDVSNDAIHVAALAFWKAWQDGETIDVGFLENKTTVAPSGGHTIPKLELCAVVLGIEIAEIIREQMD